MIQPMAFVGRLATSSAPADHEGPENEDASDDGEDDAE
jgi:hypothetical protein